MYSDTNDTEDEIRIPNSTPGQHFHMDFGFVRGSQYSIKQEDNPTITSKDGYNSYLIIVDQASRYTWIFLTTNVTSFGEGPHHLFSRLGYFFPSIFIGEFDNIFVSFCA